MAAAHQETRSMSPHQVLHEQSSLAQAGLPLTLRDEALEPAKEARRQSGAQSFKLVSDTSSPNVAEYPRVVPPTQPPHLKGLPPPTRRQKPLARFTVSLAVSQYGNKAGTLDTLPTTSPEQRSQLNQTPRRNYSEADLHDRRRGWEHRREGEPDDSQTMLVGPRATDATRNYHDDDDDDDDGSYGGNALEGFASRPVPEYTQLTSMPVPDFEPSVWNASPPAF